MPHLDPVTPAECTVLVVDDHLENLKLLCDVLGRAGYTVLPALSGALALSALEQRAPDLILLDVCMPGMDGHAVCQHIKRDPRTRDVPVIFISANDEAADRMSAFQAGAVDYVSKPFCEEEVLARVRTHVRLHRHAIELEQQVAARTCALAASEANLLQLSIFLQRVREEDRTHFARELHDELGQNLTALRIDCNALANVLGEAGPLVRARLQSIDQMISATVDATRRICEDMRPGMLDDLGLEAALSNYAKRFSAQYDLVCDLSMDREDYGLDATLSTTVYRIVQEALTNIARHARASHAMVALQDLGDTLLLSIADDGCGFPLVASEPDRKRFGMLGMAERVKMLGGRLSIDSAPGRGTHVEVSIPRMRPQEQTP